MTPPNTGLTPAAARMSAISSGAAAPTNADASPAARVGLLTEAHLRLRRLRRKVIVWIRNRFRIDEDRIRDELVDGLRRDNYELGRTLAQTRRDLDALNKRLEFHENGIPRMRTLREKFDAEQKRQLEEEAKRLQGKVEQQAKHRAALDNGILKFPQAGVASS